MKIDFNTLVIAGHSGYGNASRLLNQYLGDIGVEFDDNADIKFNFCMPPKYRYGDVSIGYTPWESTEVPDTWMSGLRKVDALWSPTSWSLDVLSGKSGNKKNNAVIPHGIEPCWRPMERTKNGPFTFIHVGSPATRKGDNFVLEAWHRRFANRRDVQLIFKGTDYPRGRIYDDEGSIVASSVSMNNVRVERRVFSRAEMMDLYSQAHCMVYPSRGEGFGLIPFEAMATGMPTILPGDGGTKDFAHLSSLVLKNHKWVKSSADKEHPGLWMEHDVDELIDLMEIAIDDYDNISHKSLMAAEQIHTLYSWNLVAEAIKGKILDLL